MAGKWISKAIKNPGALHKALGYQRVRKSPPRPSQRPLRPLVNWDSVLALPRLSRN